MSKSDTSAAAAEIQLEILRRMPPASRLELAVDMSVTARALLGARLRSEHPDWSEPRFHRELLRLTLEAPTVLSPSA